MFIAKLFTIAKACRQPKCPSTEEWIKKKMWYIHTMEHYSAIKKKEITPFAATWIDRVQFSSVAQSYPTLCDPINRSMPGLPIHHQLPEFTQTHAIELMMPSNHLILCCPLLLLPSIFPSIKVFSNEWILCIRWPKDWSFSFNISPSNEYSGLISFRMDSLDLLAVQGTLESSPTLQFKSINSLALSFLYSPTLTSIHDKGKSHSFT